MQKLNENDFKLVSLLVNSLKDNQTLNEGNIKKAFTIGLDKSKHAILKKILDSYLIPKIGNYNIFVAMYLNEFYPWAIHTDYPKGDNLPGYAVLIPLETINTHTVIFNEECKTDFEDYKKNNSKVENNCLYLAQTLLSHCNIRDLEYVSLKESVSWEEGKLIIWDRKLLHSSDNFMQNDIKNKRALVIFTTKDNIE